MNLAEALADRSLIVVCGAGGVGKTSVSAALALHASRDRKAMVVTIDPAKRLASALGLTGQIGHAPSVVPTEGGSLEAAMLDMKSAWDELVDRHSPAPDVAQRIKKNRLYQGLSEHFVGSQGYMAMERLADLHDQGRHDVIIIDTPPTRSALDFLEAPQRVTDFVGGSLLKWIAKPYAAAGRFGLRAFNFTASPFLKLADRVLGSQVLEDLSAFVLDFQKLYDGFKSRAAHVLELLRAPSTAFVVVTTLEGPPLREAGFFIDRLVDEGLALQGVVANRVIPPELASLSTHGDAEVRRASDIISTLARRDAARLSELQHRARAPVAHVPLLGSDVHDLDTLRELGDHVIGSGG